MVPPKKDAFADLFQSASSGNSTSSLNSKLNNLSLSERQKLQQQQQQQQQRQQTFQQPTKNTLLQSQSQNNSVNSSWSNIDILTPSRTASPVSNSGNSELGVSLHQTGILSAQPEDPFLIFLESKSQNLSSKSDPTPVNRDNSKSAEISLLDDDFTDFFQESKSASKSVASPSILSQTSEAESHLTVLHSKRASNRANEQKDFVVAELVDIGFSVEDANEAINKRGLDLQKCVNYIMSKNSGNSNTDMVENGGSVLGQRPEGIKLNELGTDLVKKANSFYNFSKRAVMQNLEQFSGPRSNNDNIPAWMKTKEKYESDAMEKKYGGEVYGTDEENINQKDIERFMKQQRERNRDRSRARFENWIDGKPKQSHPSSKESSPELPQRPLNSNRHGIMSSQKREPPRRNVQQKASIELPQRPARKSQVTAPPERPTSINHHASDPVSVNSSVNSTTPDEDLLGLGTSGTSNGRNAPAPGSFRDSSPLNQFVYTDYTTAKEKATAAYKSGDYTTALESYTICLGCLPPNHELRVVILSNLASVNKLLGHLKESLDNIKDAEALFLPQEILSDYEIADKLIKYWCTKLFMIKAEVLELLEKYSEALEQYLVLIRQLNCNDKKVMDGKRRVDKIVNPQNYKPPKPSVSSRASTPSNKTPAVETKRPTNSGDDEVDALTKDKIEDKIRSWADAKQNNLRAMLTNLNEIIPPNIRMSEKLRNLTTNDLMLPKQVKIQYMKVISSIHPDKLASQTKDNRELGLICNGVFITLNKRWEAFKQEENI